MENSWIDACLERKSVRFYDGRKINKEILKNLLEFTEKTVKEKLPWRKFCNIRVYYTAHDFNNSNIQNCPEFLAIVGSRNASREELMECGYVFEKIILYANRLGIATCWVGGRWLTDLFDDHYSSTKNKDKNIKFDEKTEKVICITPIGKEGVKKKGFFSNLFSSDSKRKGRVNPQKIFFNGEASVALENTHLKDQRYSKVFDCFRWSPSAVNLQKWKIVKEKGADIFHFFTNPSSSFYSNIDIGIGMCNWFVSSVEIGVKGKFLKLENNKFDEKAIQKIFGKNGSKYIFLLTCIYGAMTTLPYTSTGAGFYENWKFAKQKDTPNAKCIYFMSWFDEKEFEKIPKSEKEEVKEEVKKEENSKKSKSEEEVEGEGEN